MILVAACGRAELTPVDLTPNETCSFCRMAISETQYAAEILTEDGDPLPFDDLLCLATYLKQKGDQMKVGAIFVMDYSSRTWVKAEHAHFRSFAPIQNADGRRHRRLPRESRRGCGSARLGRREADSGSGSGRARTARAAEHGATPVNPCLCPGNRWIGQSLPPLPVTR